MKLTGVVELNFKEGEKVNISPVGEVVGVDGRNYNIDGETVIKNTQETNVDLVLDVNHGYAKEGESAAGWFDVNSLELRSDGIYASLNTTEIGKEHIDKRFYRYLSPAYIMDRNKNDRSVLSLDSVGLVNKPNVLDKALNNQDENQNKEQKNMLTPEQIAALQTQNETLEAENKTLQEANKTLTTQVAEHNRALNLQKIETAIKTGELMPNKKEFAQGLDAQMLDNFLELNAKDAEHLKKETNQDAEQNGKKISDEEREVNAQLGINEKGEEV